MATQNEGSLAPDAGPHPQLDFWLVGWFVKSVSTHTADIVAVRLEEEQ